MRAEIIGGLGNQLFSYFGAMSYALHFNKKLEIDYRYINESFEDKSNSISQLLTPSKTYKHKIFLDVFRQTQRYRYHSPEVGFDSKLYEYSDLKIIRGYFQSYRYFLDFLSFFPTWGPTPLNPSVGYLESIKCAISNQPIIIHLRRGDYRNLTNSHGLIAFDYYLSILEELRSKISGREIWVFGDELSELSKLRNLITKMGFECKVISFHEKMSSLENMIVMSRGSAHIIGNSTFAWWAATFANGNSDVYCPDKWFRGLEDPLELIPPLWEKRTSIWEN